MPALTAPELKQQGNTFFKSGSLSEAARCFAQAEAADATDVVYPSNLSAALYETGDYAACVDAIVRAWRLLSLNDAQASEPLVQRLSTRLAKALCHGARCGTVTHAMVNAPANQRAIAELSTKSKGTSTWEEWNAYPSREYYTIGQDAPMSLLDDWGSLPEYESPIDLNKIPKNELGELSFLLGGVGDARHVYSSLIGAERAYLRLPHSKRDSFRLHFNLLDIHPAPLARDLCVMLLLDQLLNVGKDDATEKAEILTTIFYIYVAVVMPSYCERRLLSTMKDLMDRLVNVPPRLPTWMHVNSEAIDPIMEILHFGLVYRLPGTHNLDTKNNPLKKALFDGTSGVYMDAVKESQALRRQEALEVLANEPPEELEMLGLTPPPHSASAQAKREYEERKERIVDALVEISKDGAGDVRIEKVWYQRTKVFMPPKALWSRHPQFESYQVMGTSAPRSPKYINSHIKKTWKPNWTLFELGKMRLNADLSRPCHFPKSFTRIYLSNIPDYTHGIINTVAFALPVVKCKEESLVVASTVLNSTIWKDDAEFIYTYTLLQPDDVERFLGCRFTDKSVIMDPTILGRALRPPALTDLASRAELEAWLVRTLVYTLAPGSNGGRPLRVRMPNNVVAFFALLMYLHGAGYPRTGSASSCNVSFPTKIRLDPWAPDFENIFAMAGRGLPFCVRLPPDYETSAEGICTLEASIASCVPRWVLPAWEDSVVGLLFYRPRPGAQDDVVKDIAGILEGRCGPRQGEVYILTTIDAVKVPRVRWKMGKRRFEMMRKAGWSMVMYHVGEGNQLASPVPAREWREV
ncbi:hypothetical protein BD779DRAFT_1695306 [Infundibulicybe gibba]|nr:hypothetical protein BD779DRAFT_1695306 [Infundibulicybe gibba]